jgi:hypothetical protein
VARVLSISKDFSLLLWVCDKVSFINLNDKLKTDLFVNNMLVY